MVGIGNQLKHLRTENRISQYKLARETGMAQSVISDTEADKREPKIETVQKWADYFGVPISYFLEGDDQEESAPNAQQERSLIERVAVNVRFLRMERGWSTEALAKSAHMAVGTVNNVENRKIKTEIDLLNHVDAISKTFGIAPDVLTEESAEIGEMFGKVRQALAARDFSDCTGELIDELVEATSMRGVRERFDGMLIKGSWYFLQGHYSKAIEWYTPAYHLAEQCGDLTLLHKSRFNLATSHSQLGNYEKVIRLIETDIQEVNHPELKAKDMLMLGEIYQKQRQFDIAEKLLLSAVEQIRAVSQEQFTVEARCYQHLGDLYRETKRHNEAIATSEKAIECARRVNHDLHETYAIRTIALTFLDRGEKDTAREWFSCLLVKTEHNPKITALESHKTRFYLHVCDMDYHKMKSTLSHIEEHEENPREMAKMYEMTARLGLALGNIEEGQHFYEKAIEVLTG